MVASALPAFERHGLGSILRLPQFQGTSRQGSIWGSHELQWRHLGAAERGFRLDRDEVDAALRMHARSVGVECLEGWRVLEPLSDQNRWRLRSAQGEEREVDAPVRIVACGRPHQYMRHPRTAQLPAAEADRESESPAGFQSCALWTLVEATDELRDATIVEAVEEGWLWSVPHSSGRICLTLFVDLEELKASGRDELFEKAVASALGPAAGRPLSRVRGTLCSPRLQRAASGTFLTGDAASNIDPLSSQGIEKSLASAEDCAYAANTCMEEPSMLESLQRHRARWEARLFNAHSRETRAFYQRETRFADAIFWRKRQADAGAAGTSANFDSQGTHSLPPGLERAPQLMEAQTLKRKSRRLISTVAFKTQTSAEAMERIGSVPIAPLLDLLPERTLRLLERARTHPRLAGLDRSLLQQALAQLLAMGFIRAADPNQEHGSRSQ
ncbi:MAG: flavin-dependent dehydrogenase [Planctomycetota bacterium]|jgi:flavin-dependent dehydrogenase